jgi:thiamine pyrophosphate-dependent acetolactate synthase large subunit-like protein
MLETKPRNLDESVQRSHQATGAELAVAMLEANGVEVVFGIPGVHTLALYDALQASSIRHILARHEQGAGFMADGYARASGQVGVAVVISGPGLTNVSTPIGEAYTDSSPVFVLSANNPRPFLNDMRGSLHDLKDQLGVMSALTQWSARAESADDVPALIGEAFRRLQSRRRLPVHVEIPTDVLDERAQIDQLPAGVQRVRLQPDPGILQEAADRIRACRRVVIYCGGGAVQAEASGPIMALAKRLGAPVITSIMGKGSVPEDHALVVGALWSNGNAVDDLLQSADCMLVFGSKLGEQATDSFRMRLPKELIRVDVDGRELSLNAHPTVGILGDALLAAEGIESLLGGIDHSAPGFDLQEISDSKTWARANWYGKDRLPYIDALRRAVPRDGIVAFDMTQVSYAACGLYPAYEPRTFMFPSGFGTLGFSLPVAIGAKVARPDTPVVCVIGDGGFQFTMAELATAIQFRQGIPIVIFNDSTYSAVKEAQAESRGGRFIGVDLVNPDYVELAKAYRTPAVRAHSPEEMETAIVEAFGRDLPTIIDVPIVPWH